MKDPGSLHSEVHRDMTARQTNDRNSFSHRSIDQENETTNNIKEDTHKIQAVNITVIISK